MVSVLTPTYKRPVLLWDTIQSVLGQTYTDFEYIIGSDGLDKDTAWVVRKLASKDPRIRFVEFPHKGQFETISALIGVARGEYVAILSDDDTWEPTFLEECVAALESTPPEYGLVYTDFYLWYPDRKEPVQEERRCNLTYENLRHACLVNTSATVFRRRWLERIRAVHGFYYDPRVVYTCGDWLMWLRMGKLAKFKHVHKVLSNYRIHPLQITNTRKKFQTMLEEIYTRRFAGVPWLRQAFDVMVWPFLWNWGIPQRLGRSRGRTYHNRDL
jgi:glycosyltransferase involved in cell wall biosynthesis